MSSIGAILPRQNAKLHPRGGSRGLMLLVYGVKASVLEGRSQMTRFPETPG